jgi:hypothetical protein
VWRPVGLLHHCRAHTATTPAAHSKAGTTGGGLGFCSTCHVSRPPLQKTHARGRACPQTHLDGVVCTGGALNLCMQTPAAGTRPVAITIPTAGGAHSHRIHCCASHPTTSASRGPPHSTGRAAVLLSLLGAWPTPPGARVQVCLGGHTQHTNTHTPHQLSDTHTGQPRDSCVGSRGPQEG